MKADKDGQKEYQDEIDKLERRKARLAAAHPRYSPEN